MIINIDRSAIENILHAFESMQSGAPDQASITIGYQSALMLKEVLENVPAVIQRETQKLERDNKIMLDAIKEAVSYPDDYYWRIINELLEKTLQDVEGDGK